MGKISLVVKVDTENKISKSINQSINQSANQLINQSINQSIQNSLLIPLNNMVKDILTNDQAQFLNIL